VLVSKPPAKDVEDQILKIAANAGKPVVVCFIGGDAEKIKKAGLYAAVSLEDAAHKAVALAKGEAVSDFEDFTMGLEKAEALAAEERAGMRGRNM
jgi:FdrA protein